MIEFLDVNAITISAVLGIFGSIALAVPMVKEHSYRRLQRILIEKGGDVHGFSAEDQEQLGSQIQTTSFLERNGLWLTAGLLCLCLSMIFLFFGLT